MGEEAELNRWWPQYEFNLGYSMDLSEVSPWAALSVSGLERCLVNQVISKSTASVSINLQGPRYKGWALKLLALGLRL